MEEALNEMKIFSSKKYVEDYHSREVLERSWHNSDLEEVEKEKILLKKELEDTKENYQKELKEHQKELKSIEEKNKSKEVLLIKNMFNKGLDDESIMEIVGITKEELTKIKLNIKNKYKEE